MIESNTIEDWEAAYAEEAKNKPKIAYLCLRVPPELIEAAGAIPIRIAPRKEFDTSINGLIRSDGCSFCRSVPAILETPCYQNVKAVIGGNCCDQMRRLLDTLGESLEIPVILYGAPRTWNADRSYFQVEFQQAFKYLFDQLDLQLDINCLESIIPLYNKLRNRIAELRMANSMSNGLLQDLARSSLPVIEKLKFLEQINTEPSGNQPIRLLLAGSIPGVWELAEIEKCGVSVVADVTCLGDRVFQFLVKESGNPWENLYDAYVEGNLCPHRRPVDPLIDNIKRMIDERAVQGVVYRSVKYCHPWGLLADRMKQELNLPVLVVDDDLTSPAVSNFRTRVGAFVEMLQSRSRRRA
ncbi:2-hydroxyacyl-CoA dehydratase family protein [bacterium]|nr:2-hydroxyacyl-CoA dehydratase family protein [bacterium]